METTQLTLADNSTDAKYRQLLDAARSVPPEIQNASLLSATWIKVHYANETTVGPVVGMLPDDRDDHGLWMSKVYPHADWVGGYAVKRVMIPWTSISQVEILAVELSEQPF